MATLPNTVIEGFVVDTDFVDDSKTIYGTLVNQANKIASLTPKALSYFNQPDLFVDKRLPSQRTVNWVPQSRPQVMLDQTIYQPFIDMMNALPASTINPIFQIIDRVLFDHQVGDTTAVLETAFAADAGIAAIYHPGSLSVSTVVTTATIYNTPQSTVNVPASVTFAIALPSGQTQTIYQLTLYASVDAFLLGYTHSSIVQVIPALPYENLYESSLIASVDNIFTTASTVTTLAYAAESSLLGTQSVSGTIIYTAIVTDTINQVPIPFTLIYKGRTPTLLDIRTAIKTALLTSGIGTADKWQGRIPGVFVLGRFYLVPLYSETETKPDQVVYPSIHPIARLTSLTNTILASLGQVDLTSYIDVLDAYYNRITLTAVPDLSGDVDIALLSTVIPDYQNYSSSEEGFAYMTADTRLFASQLNTVLAVDAGALTSTTLTPLTENLLTFYSFTVDRYEICVLTKNCVSTILGDAQ